MFEVSESVKQSLAASGHDGWLHELPTLVAGLERDWSCEVGKSFLTGTEAFVAEARLSDGTPAVLKVVTPGVGESLRHEITTLRLAGGEGCPQLLRDDPIRGALLLERLGRPMSDLGMAIDDRHEALWTAAQRIWRPAPGHGLPTGAEKGRWLIDCISRLWTELDEPCSERAVDYAVACAERRIAAHDDERAVLVHGDVHQWNALEAPGGFKLVDPDGLLAEAEYDMGIVMREDPVALSDTDPRSRARWLAQRTGLDATAIWEWGVVERMSTGLLCTQINMQPVARQMLAVADAVSGD